MLLWESVKQVVNYLNRAGNVVKSYGLAAADNLSPIPVPVHTRQMLICRMIVVSKWSGHDVKWATNVAQSKRVWCVKANLSTWPASLLYFVLKLGSGDNISLSLSVCKQLLARRDLTGSSPSQHKLPTSPLTDGCCISLVLSASDLGSYTVPIKVMPKYKSP